jgi:hypothetical protein
MGNNLNKLVRPPLGFEWYENIYIKLNLCASRGIWSKE